MLIPFPPILPKLPVRVRDPLRLLVSVTVRVKLFDTAAVGVPEIWTVLPAVVLKVRPVGKLVDVQV